MEKETDGEQESDTWIGQSLRDRHDRARIRAAKERAARIEDALEKLEKLDKENPKASQGKSVSETDPDAEFMKHGNGGGTMPSYNLQLGTDASNGVIVAVEITEEKGDSEQLIGIAKQVEENLGRLPEKALADGAYITRSNILEAHNIGVDLYGPTGNGVKSTESNMKSKGIDMAFSPEHFKCDPGMNVMICPAGKRLKYRGNEPEIGTVRYRYHALASDCQNCPHKMLCCPKTKSGRSVSRYEDDPLVTEFKKKMETDEAKDIYKCRSQVAEFPNACIKKKYRLTQFFTRGVKKVLSEAIIACTAHNIQIWKRMRWKPAFIGQET
jgi:transposase